VERRADVDRADPAVRAAARARSSEARERSLRVVAGVTLGAAAALAPVAARALTGDPGAIVGAVVAALLLAGLAAVVWPYEWSAEERTHRQLEAIWRELRADADELVPWERYAAWAEPAGRDVELSLIGCAPGAGGAPAAPSPYRCEAVRRLPADDMEAAAQAMEDLRAEAARLELEGRRRHERRQRDAEQAMHERTLREIDEGAAAQVAANEERLRRELAAQEDADRRAQAEALARALRRR